MKCFGGNRLRVPLPVEAECTNADNEDQLPVYLHTLPGKVFKKEMHQMCHHGQKSGFTLVPRNLQSIHVVEAAL